MSKYRPRCPIIGVTRNPVAARQMHLWRGLYPYMFTGEKLTDQTHGDEWISDVENRVQKAIETAIAQGFSRRGDTMVVLTGWRGGSGNTNTLRIITA